MVREFDLDPSGNLWIVLDMDRAVQVGEGAESTEEYGVIMAASLAAEMLRQNRAVGLCATGEEPLLVPPGYGLAQLWKLLHLLATASAHADCSLANALWEVGPTLGRGLTLAVITPSSEPNWIAPLLPLARRGIAASAILLDGGSFSVESSGPHPGGLATLRSALADQGVPSHVISQGFPFSPMIRHRRTRVVQKVLWGTGRVVTMEVEEEV
jgi:hypothetical protein